MDDSTWMSFFAFLAGMAVATLLIRWLANRAINRLLDEIEADTIENDTIKVIEANIEFDQNMFLVYNKKNGSFLAQGKNLEELKQHIMHRYKDIDIKIVGGDTDAFNRLKEQVKLNESSSSVGPTP